MLDEAVFGKLLHASRIVPLNVANPHGPLGLEHLAAAVALARGENLPQRIERPISLSVEVWAKLDNLAHAQTLRSENRSCASEVAAVLLEQLVSGQP